MLRTSKLAMLSLAAAGVVALSLAAMTPAQARGGGWYAHLTTQFMMDNGSRLSINTRQEALASQRDQAGQLASTGDNDQKVENRGWFVDLISICDHLKDTGVTCE